MKYLEKFENFKYESVNEENSFVEVGLPLAAGLFSLLPLVQDIYYNQLDDQNEYSLNRPDTKKLLLNNFIKPFQKVVNFFKTAPTKIKNSIEDATSSIQSIGMEDEAVKWITDNIVNNKELQEELKSIDAKVEEINSKMSVLNTRKEVSDVSKSHHLDQLKNNNQKLLNSLEYQKKSVSMRAKGLLNQLQLDNKPLYKALMSSMEKLKQDNQLLSIMTERFRIKI
jgi:hypothetical protein